MLKIGSIRWRGKCPRHPHFDPYLDGPGAVKGGCEKCTALLDIHNHHVKMLALMRRFNPPPEPKRRDDPTKHLQASLFGEM